MVRSELVKMLAAKYPNILYKEIEKITHLIFIEISEARTGRNPKNSEIVQVHSKKAVRWKMSKVLFNHLNKNFTEKKISDTY